MMFDYNKLPATRSEIEAMINAMDSEETLAAINEGRKRMLDPNHDPSELEVVAGIMLVRRLRGLRESKTRVKKAAAAPKAVPSLNDLL